MKIEPKFYKVFVESRSNNAGLICSTYNLDSSKEIVGIEYYEMVYSSSPHGLKIPSSRQATFQEELRVLHQAASTYEGPRNIETAYIEARLSEAYDNIINIHISEIDAQKNP